MQEQRITSEGSSNKSVGGWEAPGTGLLAASPAGALLATLLVVEPHARPLLRRALGVTLGQLLGCGWGKNKFQLESRKR